MADYTINQLRTIVRDNRLDIPLSGSGVTKKWIYNKIVESGIDISQLTEESNKKPTKETNKKPTKETNKKSTKKPTKDVQSESNGLSSNLVLFYSHVPSKALKFSGNKDFIYLSNWSHSIFVDSEGNKFYSNEQYMMWRKATLFKDKVVADELLQFGETKEWNKAMAAIKKLGRKVSVFDQDVWEANRYNIMVEGLLLKFSQSNVAKDVLLSTGDKLLAEAAPRDRIWGIGLGPLNSEAQDPSNWKGLNLLGKALMEVRERIKE